MHILVTAGNTQTPVDDVRCLTNIFSGRTGAAVAAAARARGHWVRLLTSHPETVADQPAGPDWAVSPYRTFAELKGLMEQVIRSGGFDAVIHSAAVSDYELAGVYVPAQGSEFDPKSLGWRGPAGAGAMADVRAGKVKSSHPELWLRLTPTPKLIDLVRTPWGYQGVLVKFKLEVGLTDVQLVEVAERSRLASAADLMVANAFERRHECAWLGGTGRPYERVARPDLPRRLLEEVERLHREAGGASARPSREPRS